MFSLRATLMLIAILLIPYAIKSFFSIEPFPAVILPSGPGKSLVGLSEFESTIITYYGISEEGEWHHVNTQKLLHPLHYPLQRYLLSSNFSVVGGNSTVNVGPSKNSLKYRLSKSKHYFQARDELKELLKQRLSSQGFNSSTLKILKHKITISIPNGDTIKSTLVDENILYLD